MNPADRPRHLPRDGALPSMTGAIQFVYPIAIEAALSDTVRGVKDPKMNSDPYPHFPLLHLVPPMHESKNSMGT